MSNRKTSGCPHEQLATEARVIRLEDHADDQARMVEVEIVCRTCGAKARWLGLPLGCDGTLQRPMVSVMREELRAPVRFETDRSAEASFIAASAARKYGD